MNKSLKELITEANKCLECYKKEIEDSIVLDKTATDALKFGFHYGCGLKEKELRENLWKSVTEKANLSYILIAQCNADSSYNSPYGTFEFKLIDERKHYYKSWSEIVDEYGIVKWCYLNDIL